MTSPISSLSAAGAQETPSTFGPATASLWELVRALTAAKMMIRALAIRDRPRFLLKSYESCFTANEAVTFLLAMRIAASLNEALRLCALLVAADVIRPNSSTTSVGEKERVREREREAALREAMMSRNYRSGGHPGSSSSSHSSYSGSSSSSPPIYVFGQDTPGEVHHFTNDTTLYKFTVHRSRAQFESSALRANPVDWALALALYQNLDLRDRPVNSWSDNIYPLCFIGLEAVTWLVETVRVAANVDEAVRMLTRLLHLRMIENSTRPGAPKPDEVVKASPSALYRFNFLINFDDVDGDDDDSHPGGAASMMPNMPNMNMAGMGGLGGMGGMGAVGFPSSATMQGLPMESGVSLGRASSLFYGSVVAQAQANATATTTASSPALQGGQSSASSSSVGPGAVAGAPAVDFLTRDGHRASLGMQIGMPMASGLGKPM